MNDLPLRLSAPKRENVRRLIVSALASAFGVCVMIWLDRLTAAHLLAVWLACAFFLLTAVFTCFFVCRTVDAVVCLFDKNSVRLEKDTLYAYNLPPMALRDISEMTLSPQNAVCKTSLTVKARDGKEIRIRQKYIDIPVELLYKAIETRSRI